MAITATSGAGDGNSNFFSASYFDDAVTPVNAAYTPGFRPRYVIVDNVTDRIKWEWYEGMAAGTNIQTVAAGTRTLITTAGVTVTITEGAQPALNFAVLQNKQYRTRATS